MMLTHCQREKFKYMHIILCHRNLYYDGFFLNSILCRCFIHELFLQKLRGFLFHFPRLNMLWFHFWLNVSLYRQYYFWDVDARCRPRTQLFVKFNDGWRPLNSHELVAWISEALTDCARKCCLGHILRQSHGPVIALTFRWWWGWWWERHWK